jgi:hypothetical protein
MISMTGYLALELGVIKKLSTNHDICLPFFSTGDKNSEKYSIGGFHELETTKHYSGKSCEAFC